MNTHPLLPKKLRLGLLSSLALFSLSAFGQSSWNVDANGNWNTASNWTPSGAPNAIGAVVNFGAVGPTTKTVTLTSARTAGTINFTSSDNYRIDAASQTLTLDVASGSAQINQTGSSGGVFRVGVTLALNDDLVVTGNSTFVQIQGAITGAHSVTLAGNMLLTGNTTYSGDTIINSGVLQLGNGLAVSGNIIGNSANIIINSGGTLNQTLLGTNNVIGDATNMTLNGGVWSVGQEGRTETLNTLTLSANSIINTSSSNVVITFAGGGVYNAGILTISNWNGSMTGGAAEQIVFGGPALSQTFLNNVFWSQQNITGARQLASGEIVPVPEASSVLAGIGLAAAAVGYEIRRRKSKAAVEAIS